MLNVRTMRVNKAIATLMSGVASALIALVGPAAWAAPVITGVTVFANGGVVGGTQPDSITHEAGSVWVEYGNGVDSTGVIPGDSTIVQYSTSGAIEHTYQISGEVDGLKVNPVTGMVWALQNQDANSTISLINPTTGTVTGPFVANTSPPYKYGPNSGPNANNGRGYDDVAFRGSQVFLSYTNPASPTDSVLQSLDQGDNPSGTLTTTSILTAEQTGIPSPDIDSLKTTPSGDLVLTSEGDGVPTSDGRFTLIAHAGEMNQTVTNVRVTDGMGNNVQGMDDVLFPGATAGTLYVTDTGTNNVYAITLKGLNPNTAIVSLGSFDEVGLVNLTTGVATPLLTGADFPDGTLNSPHGLDFIPSIVPEPGAWALMLVGLGGVGAVSRRRREAGPNRSLGPDLIATAQPAGWIRMVVLRLRASLTPWPVWTAKSCSPRQSICTPPASTPSAIRAPRTMRARRSERGWL